VNKAENKNLSNFQYHWTSLQCAIQ